ncbi:hypothetical protein [Mycobacteroides abscessus]|uniref:hypothetical protein n=1 Tax=Mycobacteroides abscessus TaxID=36809 RepID=UPI0009A58FBA|nr:hypothetical protein [Mycobacteroides abscessus]RIT48830.1 hypothetical protein D2E80_12045 [Mycobacteroides abscessus]SKT87504.1 Uncharacterised protein [Mycobacteroides abscessus subsp. massiliense]SKU07854.1 Uncharacterised protein [Mycobacteroides abscessus subsp. massiliense]
MTGSQHEPDDAQDSIMKNPIKKLFRICLMLLGCAIALNLMACLLTNIWPWVIGIVAVAALVTIWIRVAAARRRKW